MPTNHYSGWSTFISKKRQTGSLLTEVLIAITVISYVYIGQIKLVTTLSTDFDLIIDARMEELGLWIEDEQQN